VSTQQEITFRHAVHSDEERVMQIIRESTAILNKAGNFQWNENYPTVNDIRNDIDTQIGIVAELDGKVVAYGAVDFNSEPAYDNIKGKWLSVQPYVVMHRLAVAPETRGLGIAKKFFLEAERIGREKGLKSFKVDTNYNNPIMLSILQKLGFTYCGEVFFEGDYRKAFEKLI
jgi:ribosomal protein S18 acetylase RimI-like enzyme